MGLISKLKAVAEAGKEDRARLEDSGSLGSVTAPGEGEVALPAGLIRLTLEMPTPTLSNQRTRNAWDFAHQYMKVELEGPAGAVPVKEGSSVVSADVSGGVRRRTYGTLEAPEKGTYAVRVVAGDDWYAEVGCRMLFDPAE